MITRTAQAKRLAYAVFGSWASRDNSIDLMEFEDLVSEVEPDTRIIDKAWNILEKNFKPVEHYTNVFTFPSETVGKAGEVLEHARAMAPELLKQIQDRVRVHFRKPMSRLPA